MVWNSRGPCDRCPCQPTAPAFPGKALRLDAGVGAAPAGRGTGPSLSLFLIKTFYNFSLKNIFIIILKFIEIVTSIFKFS